MTVTGVIFDVGGTLMQSQQEAAEIESACAHAAANVLYVHGFSRGAEALCHDLIELTILSN